MSLEGILGYEPKYLRAVIMGFLSSFSFSFGYIPLIPLEAYATYVVQLNKSAPLTNNGQLIASVPFVAISNKNK